MSVKRPCFNALKMQQCSAHQNGLAGVFSFVLHVVLFLVAHLGNKRLRPLTMNDFVMEAVLF